jgi:hypothetical protein
MFAKASYWIKPSSLPIEIKYFQIDVTSKVTFLASKSGDTGWPGNYISLVLHTPQGAGTVSERSDCQRVHTIQ